MANLRAPHGAASFVVLLLVCTLAILGPDLFSDPDIGWHLAAGDWARAHGAITRIDPFSHTAGEYPWLNISWGWDIALSWLYEHAGWTGLKLFHVLLASLVVGCLIQQSRAMGAQLTVIIASLILAMPALYATLNARPHISCWPLILITGWMFHSWWQGRLASRWLLIGTIPLLTLWANINGSFLIWFTVGGAYGVQALLEREWKRAGIVIVAAAVALASVCLHPLGIDVFEACWRTLGGEMTQYIREWSAADFGPDGRWRMLYPMAALLLLSPVWRHLSTAHRVLLIGWLVLALTSQRHLPVLVLLTLPFMTASVSRWLEIVTTPWAAWLHRKNAEYEADLGMPSVRMSLLTICTGAVLAISVMLYEKADETDYAPTYPREAIAALEPYDCLRIWNHYNLGGWIIHATQGQWPVFVDGRAETAYPTSVLRDEMRINRLKTDLPSILQKHDVDMVVFLTESSQWITYYGALREWRRVYQDDDITAYVRSELGETPCMLVSGLYH